MDPNRDYTRQPLLIALLVIVLLAGISLLPAFQVGGIRFKRINILSDLFPREDTTHSSEAIPGASSAFDSLQQMLAETAAEAEAIGQAEESVLAASGAFSSEASIPVAGQWDLFPENPSERETRRRALPAADSTGVIPIEDFGETTPAMGAFYTAWEDSTRNRPLRIAMLGDSFIEGDILTADLREQLQNVCGGGGPGFVPFASPMSKLRASIALQYENWEIRTIQQRNTLGEELRNKFFVSGVFSCPGEGATTYLRGTAFRRHLDRCDVARLIFINRGNTQLNVQINDSISRTFTPPSGEQVQQIVIHAPIRSVRVSFSQTEGFIGYGISLEEHAGASIDNFSIRGNSGLALYGTDRTVNYQIDRLIGYDLIILQYGLNVMSADVLQYTSYRDKLIRLIAYVQQCFPRSSILVMGVGDRSTQHEGQFVTMPGVEGMVRAQREAASEAGVAFWNTYEAMGGRGSMVHFVRNRWAAQDYTHIRHPGGKVIAGKLASSLLNGRQQSVQRNQRQQQQREDALRYQVRMEQALEPASAMDTQPQGPSDTTGLPAIL